MVKSRQKRPRQLDMFPELPARLPRADAERSVVLADLPLLPESPGLFPRFMRRARKGDAE